MISKISSFILSIILIIYCFSCTNESSLIERESFNFDKIYKINPVKLSFNSPLGEVFNMFIIDSILIINSYDRNFVLHFFDKRDGSFIKNQLHKGNGPTEFIPTGFVVSKKENDIYVFAPGMKLIRKYNFQNLFSSSLPDDEVHFEKFARKLVPIGSNFIASTFLKERFLLFNNQGECLSKYDKFPRFTNQDDTNALRIFYSIHQDISVKPDQSKFVSTTRAGSVIQVFGIDKDTIKLLIEKGFEQPILSKAKGDKGFPDNECVVGFCDLQTTNEYIYVLYSGVKIDDFNKRNSRYVSNNVYVFDWNCRPIKRYEIKDGRATSFCIDEKEQKIYLYSILEDGETTLSYFEL